MNRLIWVPGSRERSSVQTGNRPSAVSAGVVLALACATASSGCDSGSCIPPPPDGLREETASPAAGSGLATGSAAWQPEPAAAKTLELILDRRDSEEAEVMTAAARTQGGLEM